MAEEGVHNTIFGHIDPGEISLGVALVDDLASVVPVAAQLVVPLGLGNHVDHQLTRQSAELLARDPWYYADFPYTREEAGELEQLRARGWQSRIEIIEVLGRPAFREKYHVQADDIAALLNLMRLRGELVNPKRALKVCRDPKDDKFLEAAITGQADAIVSGDSDLIELRAIEKIPILRPVEFLAKL